MSMIVWESLVVLVGLSTSCEKFIARKMPFSFFVSLWDLAPDILVFQQLLANLTVQKLKTGSNFLFRRGKIGKTEHFARNIDLNLSSVLVVNCESNAKALESCLKDRPVIRRKERRKESGTITTPVATKLVIRVIKLTNLVFAAGVLMQANDILRNPGPHCLTCSLCSKKIRKNQGQVVCEACCGHFHLKCIGPDFEVTKCCKNCAFMSTPESMDGSESNETFIPKLDGLTDLLKQKGLKLCHQNMRSLLPKITLYWGKSGCIRAKWLYLGKSCGVRAKVVVFVQICCIRAKVVLFGQ